MRKAMVLLLPFILALLLSGCAAPVFTSIGAAFAPFVGDFEALYGSPLKDVVVMYASPSSLGALSECETDSNGQKIVRINEETWTPLCDLQKRALIFHELGHCILGRDHTTSNLSYMYPDLQTCQFYLENQAQLDAELFSTPYP